jgi:tetraacyldisaccharide 4'-kinase
MTRKPPVFWTSSTVSSCLIAIMMTPFSWLWQLAGWLRWRLAKPYHAEVAVICVGNLSVGGVGKTPFVRALALMAKAAGFSPVILMRGYGGNLPGPVSVSNKHSTLEVGDEALELKASCSVPVIVARDRAAGARWIESHDKGDLIIMDDGFQNPRLKSDRAVLVFDGETGLGNGKIVPAGPLRESMTNGLKRASHALIIGSDQHGLSTRIHHLAPHIEIASANKGYDADTRQLITDHTILDGRLMAFAGIGNPQGFFDAIKKHGGHLVASLSFADHHHYTSMEWEQIISTAEMNKARPVTTMKDYMRLTPAQQTMVTPLPLELLINEQSWMKHLLAGLDKGRT